MSLTNPYFIEYLLSLRGSGGDPLLYRGSTQAIVDPFPPSTAFSFLILPPANTYAIIKFFTQIGLEVLPDVFDYSVNHRGIFFQQGTVTQTVLDLGVPAFFVITERDPVTARITNNSVLAQYWEFYLYYVAVPTVEALGTVFDELAKLKVSP